jgi:hypothetical protein
MYLTDNQTLRCEIFCDWLPTDDCFVSLDNSVKDKWDSPVAKIRIGYHEHNFKAGDYINEHWTSQGLLDRTTPRKLTKSRQQKSLPNYK